jgi:biotin carboxyl carrier protein
MPAVGGPTPSKATPPVTSPPVTTTPGKSDPTPGKSDGPAPSVPASKDATPEKSPSVTKDSVKDAKDASKETPSSKSTTTGKDAKEASKDLPSSKSGTTGKDASSSKTVPTSTVTPPPSSPKSLVVQRALVTLIHDNKVPATEAGMLMGPLPVEEGSSVDLDEQVAQIDNRSMLAKQKIAHSEYLGAKAQSENDAEVEVAEAAIKVSEEEYQMNIDIQKKNPAAVSASQVRKDKFNVDKARAQKKQAENEKHIAGLTANAKYAQYEAASIELDLRQIKAPFKGEVVEIMKRPGDWVTAGEAIMHIVGLDRVRVKGFVFSSGDEGASPVDVMGKDVKITVEGAGGKKATVNGKIGFASPVIEGVGTSRQFRVWAEVDNEKITDPVTKQVSWKLQPGSVATMTIDLSPPKPQPAATRTFKPVTGDEKSESKKSKREF